MAIQKVTLFELNLAGNGKAEIIAVDFTKDPVFVESPSSGQQLSNNFSFLSTPITGIVSGSLVSSVKGTVTATVENGIATFTFSTPPAANKIFTLAGAATVNVLE